jgi:hypothetical protein
LRYVHDQAIDLGIGKTIDLVPGLENPKDLFSLTLEQNGRTVSRKAA